MMTKHIFGTTGIRISPLGIGCTDNAEVITLLLDAGCNLLDTAQCYGPHEAFVGEHFARRRDDFFCKANAGITKSWPTAPCAR